MMIFHVTEYTVAMLTLIGYREVSLSTCIYERCSHPISDCNVEWTKTCLLTTVQQDTCVCNTAFFGGVNVDSTYGAMDKRTDVLSQTTVRNHEEVSFSSVMDTDLQSTTQEILTLTDTFEDSQPVQTTVRQDNDLSSPNNTTERTTSQILTSGISDPQAALTTVRKEYIPTSPNIIVESTTAQILTSSESALYRDCKEVPLSGVYKLRLKELKDPVVVYCDMETDDGGWIVILRRENGVTDFNLPLKSYVNGFGNLTNEFWMGLSFLRDLTRGNRIFDYYSVSYETACEWELRIDVEDWSGNIANACYDCIAIYHNKYKIEVGSYSGNAGNELDVQMNRPFSTRDNDNDNAFGNLAQIAGGGWWYNLDTSPNLCGWYCEPKILTDCTGAMTWGWLSPLKKAEMKIRRLGNP